jgi:hypothetical protein
VERPDELESRVKSGVYRAYESPKLGRVGLAPEETVFTSCKTDPSGGCEEEERGLWSRRWAPRLTAPLLAVRKRPVE